MERLQRLLQERKITLDLDAKARAWLADKGYDPAYGARPLKRVIQKYVQDPLAEMILGGEVVDGTTVPISVSGASLSIGERLVGGAGAPDDTPRGTVVSFPKGA